MTRTSVTIAHRMLKRLVEFVRKNFTHPDTYILDDLCSALTKMEIQYPYLKESK